jgi:hypothetical protein
VTLDEVTAPGAKTRLFQIRAASHNLVAPYALQLQFEGAPQDVTGSVLLIPGGS